MGAHGRDAEDEGSETLQGDRETHEGDEPRRSVESSGRVDSMLAAIASAPSMPITVGPGDRLADNFEIERRLGIGGMGIVYLAHHLVLDRKVAIKLHRTDSQKAAELLLREARAIASVEDEHVIVVHEVGTFQNYVFVAMEYVDGWTAREWVAQANRTWREIVALYVKAGRGLHAAHERGLTHRDFKPDNVLVGRDGRVRVADFGLARAAAAQEDDVVTMPMPVAPTVTEGVVGSPGYMAPEQFRSGSVDARADQFGFCVSLFEALAGKRPYAGTALPEIVEAVTYGDAAALDSEHAPAHVRAVLRRGLDRDPAARYPDMAALLADLDRDPARARWRAAKLVGAVGVTVAATWWITRVQDPMIACRTSPDLGGWWDAATRGRVEAAFLATGKPLASDSFAAVDRLLDERHTAAQAILETACDATHHAGTMSRAQLDDLGGCLVQSEREQRALVDLLQSNTIEVIDRSVTATESLPAVARCTSEFRTDDVAAADRSRADDLLQRIARADELAEAGLQAQAVTEAQALEAEVAAFGYPAIEARLALVLGRAHDRLRRPDLASPPLRHGLQRALIAGDERLAVELATALMFAEGYQAGKVDAGEAWTTVAEGLLERLGQPADLRYRFLHNHALVLRTGERFPESLAAAEEALVRIEEAGASGGMRHAALLGVIGEGQRVVGHPERGLETIERSLALYRRNVGDAHPSTINALNILGSTQMNLGDSATAETTLREALRLVAHAQTSGRAPIEIRANLSSAISNLGRTEEALAMLEQAWVESKQPGLPDDMQITIGQNLAGQNESSGRFARGREVVAETLRFASEKIGTESIGYAELLKRKAELADPTDARTLADVEEATRIISSKLDPEVPMIADMRTTRGLVLARLGRCAEAMTDLDIAERNLVKAFGERHALLARNRRVTGRCLAELGRSTEAIAKLEDVRELVGTDAMHDYHEWLVKAYVTAGRLDDARAQYDRVRTLGLSPESLALFDRVWPTRP